jgi:hypothetical protein
MLRQQHLIIFSRRVSNGITLACCDWAGALVVQRGQCQNLARNTKYGVLSLCMIQGTHKHVTGNQAGHHSPDPDPADAPAQELLPPQGPPKPPAAEIAAAAAGFGCHKAGLLHAPLCQA